MEALHTKQQQRQQKMGQKVLKIYTEYTVAQGKSILRFAYSAMIAQNRKAFHADAKSYLVEYQHCQRP